MGKRAFLIGHTVEKPGAIRKIDGKTERKLLEYQRDYLMAYWKATSNWVVIDQPHGCAADNYSGIMGRINQATKLNVEFAIELHINNISENKPDDYAIILHNKKATGIAKSLAEHFRKFLYDAGIERLLVQEIPAEKWPNYAALTHCNYPAIIFEPFFINNPKHHVAELTLTEFCPLLVNFMETFQLK